jgi:hypothetical protein
VVERLTNGRFYGTPVGFLLDGKEAADTPSEAWQAYREHHAAALEEAATEHDRNKAPRYQLKLQTADGQKKLLPLENIVRAYPANQLGVFGRLGVYLSRWREFLCDGPREANSEGGVFPAIFGTVVMTLLMSIAVVPFGVLAALYLREYAKAGPTVSALRIAINNQGAEHRLWRVWPGFLLLSGRRADRSVVLSLGGIVGIRHAGRSVGVAHASTADFAGGNRHHRRGAGRGAQFDA